MSLVKNVQSFVSLCRVWSLCAWLLVARSCIVSLRGANLIAMYLFYLLAVEASPCHHPWRNDILLSHRFCPIYLYVLFSMCEAVWLCLSPGSPVTEDTYTKQILMSSLVLNIETSLNMK